MWIIAHGCVEVVNILNACVECPTVLSIVHTGKYFIFWGSQYGVLHVQIAVVGVYAPIVINAICDVTFYTPVSSSTADVFGDESSGSYTSQSL